MLWSTRHEQVVARLVADSPPHADVWVRSEATRLAALPIGWDLWSHWFLRPNGEVVLVGNLPGEPEGDEVHADRSYSLRAMVWGAERYPELQGILPARGPGAVDCRCRAIPLLASGKVLCPECSGLGWRPPADA